MDEQTKTKIALFRYSIIAPLITDPDVTPADRGKYFRDAAKKRYENIYGDFVSPSSYTIYRYYRLYMKGGFEALKPKGRTDVGRIRKLDEDAISQITYLHKEYPRLPATMIYQRLIENGTLSKDEVSLSTVTRYLSRIKQQNRESGKEYRRYELAHINEVWYGDSSVGPYLRVGKKKQKTWIIALIDDASRYVVGIDIFFNDNFVNLMSVIRSAVIRCGKPKTFKFDNGSGYRSNQMELLGARLGSVIQYAPPRTPTGKAKIERWFLTMKTQWMANLNMNDFHSLDELRESLMAYVQHYNQTPHSSLDSRTPQDRFFDESSMIIRLDDQRINETFLLEVERRVSQDCVINIDNVEYEVDYRYTGQRLLLRYAPDLSKIYSVDRVTGEMSEIHLLDKRANSTMHRSGRFMISKGGE